MSSTERYAVIFVDGVGAKDGKPLPKKPLRGVKVEGQFIWRRAGEPEEAFIARITGQIEAEHKPGRVGTIVFVVRGEEGADHAAA